MRRRAWAAWILVALALLLGFIGLWTDVDAFNVLAGLCWIAALLLGISLLPFWSQLLPDVPPMPGLFTAPHDDERWCSTCGSPAPEGAPCGVCGDTPREKRHRGKDKSTQS